jgi:hypothetical protein
MKSFDFTLSGPVSFQGTGENKKTTLLTFYAPSVKHRKRAAKLKSGFMQAVSSIEETEAKQSKSSEEIKPSEILALLQMYCSNYDEYLELFLSLATDGVCKLDGSEVKLQTHNIEDTAFDDLERMMGEYLVNFIVGSLGN